MKLLWLVVVMVAVSQADEGIDFDSETQELASDIASQPLKHINRVLIYLNSDASLQLSNIILTKLYRKFPFLSIEFYYSEYLMTENDRTILAVIAPKPLKDVSHSEIPVYFYDEPYLMKNYLDILPNAVTFINNWRPLKHAFTHIFEEQNWLRIAIISDNSPYSAAFEEELIGHFHAKGLVYNVQRCDPRYDYCNFWAALKFIKEEKAYIVVANVDERNVEALAEAALACGVTSWNKYVWITRDSVFSNPQAAKMGSIFSLALAPMLKQKNVYQELETENHGPHLASILHGLSLIADAVQETKRERIDYFYRDIAQYMNNISDTTESQVYIRKITKEKSSVVSVGTFKNHDVISFSHEPVLSSVKRYDLEDCILMRSEVFTDPCNDILVLLLVTVGMMFVLMMFLLAYFFNRCTLWT